MTKKSETSAIDQNHKVAGILRAILGGHQVKIGDSEWALGERPDGSLDLCLVGSRDDGSTVLLPTGASLGAFIRIAEKATDDEWTIIAAGLTLSKIGHGRAR